MKKPKKSKELTQRVADELNIPKEKVDAVIDFYFSCIKNKLNSLEHTHIYIHGLGTFRGSSRKTEISIKSLSTFLSNEQKVSFTEIAKVEAVKEKLEKRKLFLEKIYKFIDDGKKFKQDMAKKKSNN
jgi:hypothetical protein